jgi:hypothetical protein
MNFDDAEWCALYSLCINEAISMSRSVAKRYIVHASPHRWRGDDTVSRYYDCLTLDPSRAGDAWEVLSEDTLAREIVSLPRLLHRAFRKELRKRAAHG